MSDAKVSLVKMQPFSGTHGLATESVSLSLLSVYSFLLTTVLVARLHLGLQTNVHLKSDLCISYPSHFLFGGPSYQL